MISITSQGPVNRHITECLTTRRGVRQYVCNTVQNPDYYRTPDGIYLPVNVGEILASKTNKGQDMLLRGKGIVSIGHTVKDDGYKFIGFRPDEVQDGSEQFEISLERVEIGGKVQTFDLSKKDAVSSITTRMGPLYIQSARQRTRVMVRATSRTDAIRMVLVIHTKGLNLVRMESLDEFWFYSIRTGKFRFRLRSPYLVDPATMSPIGGDSPLPPMVRHSLTEIFTGEYRYIKETTDAFSNMPDLPFPLLVDADTVYSSTADGVCFSNPSANWATCWGSSGSGSDATMTEYNGAHQAFLYSGTYYCNRSFYTHSLSLLSGTCTACSWFGYGYGKNQSRVSIQQGTQADSLVAGDFDSFSENAWGYSAAWSLAGYNEVVFDATGIAAVTAALGSAIKLCGREYDHDYLNSAPDGEYRNGVYYSETSGTSKDPKLILTITSIAKAPILRRNHMRHMLVR